MDILSYEANHGEINLKENCYTPIKPQISNAQL